MELQNQGTFLTFNVKRFISSIVDFGAGVDFLAFPPINIGESYKKWKGLRKVISQSNSSFATLHLICPDI